MIFKKRLHIAKKRWKISVFSGADSVVFEKVLSLLLVG
jgi:hypothetical protein